MRTVKGQPITGTNIENSKKRPFVPNAKDTSADAQSMIDEPPQPFKNRMTTANAPSPSGASGGISTLEPKIASGLKHSSPGVRALPQGGAIGQNKPINQSGQVNGRMGTSFPRKVGSYPKGYPSKRNARFYGE